MIPVAVSYFDISAEQEWDGDRGHHVSVGYSADIPDTVADDRFDLLENVEFVMEWKETSGDGSEKLIVSRIIRAFPQERLSVVAGGQISRQRRVFITRRDLRWEDGFPEMAEMFCRVSLTPILTTARRSIPIERINGRYRMIPGQIGNPSAKITPGFEY